MIGWATLDSAVEIRSLADLTSAAKISSTLNESRGFLPTISRKIARGIECSVDCLATVAVIEYG